jgi:hypothetical protein
LMFVGTIASTYMHCFPKLAVEKASKVRKCSRRYTLTTHNLRLKSTSDYSEVEGDLVPESRYLRNKMFLRLNT